MAVLTIFDIISPLLLGIVANMEIIGLILAAYAITRTISREFGPFAVFETLRERVERHKPQPPTEPQPTAHGYEWNEYNKQFDQYEQYIYFWRRSLRGYLAEALTCAYCLSFYSAALVASYWYVSTGIYWYSPVVYFAIVGGVHLLLKIEDK